MGNLLRRIPEIQQVPRLEILPLYQLGLDELLASGMNAWEAGLELAVRGCRELGIERALVPPSFPLGHADNLRANGIEVEDATWYKLRSLAEGYGLADQLEFTEVE